MTVPSSQGPFVSRRRALLGIGLGAAALGAGPAISACSSSGEAAALDIPSGPTGASDAVRQSHRAVFDALPFHDRGDFADADRGFVKTLDPAVVHDSTGKVVWDVRPYDFLDGESPDTMNPSLWRQAQLSTRHGLYEVAPRVFQIRGLDLSNMTILEGERGIVVIDPLISMETAAAALALYRSHRGGDRPVVAVIYSHSHADHFGGTYGVTTAEDVAAGRCEIIAPPDFVEHAAAENIYVGTAMGRRATYMYGAALEPGPAGQASVAIGHTTSGGTVGIANPTSTIGETGETRVVDGIRMTFQLTPGAEAPSDMNVHFGDLRIFYVADNALHSQHNILTLRGALVRDATQWARFLTESINLFGRRSDIVIGGHLWPVWGTERGVEYLSAQRDLYAYLHDQTVRHINSGMTGPEIAEQLRLSPALEKTWSARGYYGSVSHNVKAVYQRYLGWFDGNPATLWEHPPTEGAKRHVRAMGGVDGCLRTAKDAYDAGDFRWAAQVLNYALFAEPGTEDAKRLQAAVFEQLAYQTENATWRNFYLTGAKELREGVVGTRTSTTSPSMIQALSVSQLFSYAATLIDAPKVWDQRALVDWQVDGTTDVYRLELRNGVLIHHLVDPAYGLPAADATVTAAKHAIARVLLQRNPIGDLAAKGDLRIAGDRGAVDRIFGSLSTPDPTFAIVLP